MPSHFIKDPDEILDYKVDWSDWLVSDTINTSTWTVPAGLTAGAASNTTTTATQWISGGTAGTTYTVTNRIVTAGLRTAERSITIKVQSR